MAKRQFAWKRLVKKGWQPGLWASRRPFGLGLQHNNSYLDILRTIWENRRELPYAWRILNHGVCDGCALGTTGMRDWTHDGIHVCYVRLNLLKVNTDPPVDNRRLADLAALREVSSRDLRKLGRLSQPLVRRKGEPGFREVGWDEALDLAAERIAATSPERLFFYLTSRGMPNESYYAAQKAVRAMGTNSIDNAARVCHSPSTSALKQAIGVGASTCSYSDWIGSDLVVFVGSNVAANQPVAMKYLHYARKAGTRVVCINTYREPGMERYWVPSVVESSLFGTRIAEETFLVDTGGDIGFLNGALKHLVEQGRVDRAFIDSNTVGFDRLAAALRDQTWEELEQASGASRQDMIRFAEMVGAARTGIFVWSMGVTQHEHGGDNVAAIINLGLSQGFVGRDRCGLMPIRGHSGVQGGAEMGAYSTALPGGLAVTAENAKRFADLWGFDVPAGPGLTAPEAIDAAHRGDLDVLFAAGGNFVEVLPDPTYVRTALGRVPLRVHMDVVLTNQMLIDPADTVVVLPAMTRYEIPGGVTETSTERRVIFSPEIPGRRIAGARWEGDVFTDLASRVRPDLGPRLRFDSTARIREEIAGAVPFYAGIENLHAEGDQFQYGGPHLCAGGVFPTPDQKAHFAVVAAPRADVPEGMFIAATRRGKQFNSMVHAERDGVTGASRDSVFMNVDDARRLALRNGDRIRLRSDTGVMAGRVLVAPVKAGNLQVHWPEGEALIASGRRSRPGGVPDYNALVRVEAGGDD